MFKSYRHRGDTILEVLVALVLLSSILISTFSILNRAISTNVNVKNRIIALNIAREGLEAVRNLRDTNWLKYSGDRRGKWLCRDSALTPNACDGSRIDPPVVDDGTGKYYTIDYDTSANRYYLGLTSLSEDLDLTSASQSDADREDYLLHLDSTNNRYTHAPTLDSTESIFYRQVFVQTVNPYHELLAAPGLPTFCDSRADEPDCFASRLNIRVVVHWLEEDRPRKLTLEGSLLDFFERNDY